MRLANVLLVSAQVSICLAAAAFTRSKGGEVCGKEEGRCGYPHGDHQTSGVIKLDDVDGNSDKQQASCLSRCLAYPGATGCEVIWYQINRGCYVHTQEVTWGNGDGWHHACWIFSKCTNSESSSGKDPAQGPKLLQMALELVTKLGMGPHKWENFLPNDIDQDNDGQLSDIEVELAFNKYIQVIFDTLDYDSDDKITKEEFKSAGIDLKLVDAILDIAFKSYPVKVLDKGLDEGVDRFWNTYLSAILIEHHNGNRQMKMERLEFEVKEILQVIFHLLDQNDDEFISVKDITTLNVKLPEVRNLAKNLFYLIDNRTGANGEIDLANNTLAKPLIEMLYGRYGDDYYRSFDKNLDGIINLKDYNIYVNQEMRYWFPQGMGLLGILSRNLDNNQDGKVSMLELDQFLTVIFKHLDSDDDESITLDDVFKLMQTQWSCLQTEAVRAFVERWKDFVESGVEEVLDHFFQKFDQNSDQSIFIEEILEAEIPCGIPFPGVPPCDVKFSLFHGEFPRISIWTHRGEDFSEKLANVACTIMQPTL